MDRLTKIIFGFIAVLVVSAGLLVLFFERVPVRTYGVKQYVWAGGIEGTDFKTGYHVGITGIHKWHLLDASTHFLEFVAAEERQGLGSGASRPSLFPKSGGPEDLSTPVHDRHPALEIRNRDGNVVTIDISVPYRIIEGQAHRIVEDGLKAFYRERVKATVESVLREVLPEMSNDALIDYDRRLETSSKALAKLKEKLQQFHVEPEAIMIRRVAFPPEYEAKLQQKQLFTQKARLDQADTLKLAEVLRTGTIEKQISAAEALSVAEWDKKMETLRTEYALKVAEIHAEALQYDKKTRAEADAKYQTKLAEGKLAIDKAEALLSQLRSEALSTTGGRIYVARQAAEGLNPGRVILSSSDPRVPLFIDVHKMADLLLGEESAPTPAPQPAAR